MRNPKRFRNVSVTVLVVSVLTDVAVINIRRPTPMDEGWYGVVVVSSLVAVTSLLCSLYFQVTHSRREGLKRGKDLIARWTVSPAEWAEYLVIEGPRNAQHPSNTIEVKPERVSGGVEVLVARGALMVDGDFHSLTDLVGLQWLNGSPHCIECNMRTRTKGETIPWTLRFPVASNAESSARAACEQLRSMRKLVR